MAEKVQCAFRWIELYIFRLRALMVLIGLGLSTQLLFAQSALDSAQQAAISNVTGYLLLGESDGAAEPPDPPSPTDDVTAILKSLTRVDGISPETIYFSAEDSTCLDCDDIFGLDTALADAYSELAYHFDFDDSDSGNFASTGNSRNRQIGGSPRAAHTFECSGAGDPNWDNTDQRCEFNVGVRVQAKDNDYGDAFLQVNIRPQYGPGGYYADENIYCVSSESDFSACPHNDASRHLTDTPNIGNWHENLILFQNGSSGPYSDICMGADEQNATAATYDVGSRPLIRYALLASRPGRCNESFSTDENIASLSDNLPERDSNGHLIDGYAFNQTITGLRLGRAANGNTFVLLNYHDIDMDWSDDSSSSGVFKMVNGAGACVGNDDLSCNLMPYPMFLMMSDMVIKSATDNTNLASPVNVGCFNECAGVNFVVMGVEVDRAVEHNIRMMGAWGLLISNSWFRGNHVGRKGGKSRVTIRSIQASLLHDLDKNPEDFDTPDYFREGGTSDWYNRYNNFVDNRINQTVQDPLHQSAGWVYITGLYAVHDGNTFYTDQFGNGGDELLSGRFMVVRNTSWTTTTFRNCSHGTGYYPDGTAYNDNDDIYVETGGVDCAGIFNGNTPPLPTPSAPTGI